MKNKRANYSEIALAWWNKNRLKYNIGLVISGILAFICYVVVLEIIVMPNNHEAEFTIFTILIQGTGYLIMMLLANLFYYLGPLSEELVRPGNVTKYRKVVFSLGYWFSFILPFSVPISILFVNI